MRCSAAASRRRPPGSCCSPTASRPCRRAQTTRAAGTPRRGEAKDKGVPISTISFGTSYGTVDIPRGRTERVPVPVDDPSLREIANLSGGSFFTASSLEELREVYDTLEEQIGYENDARRRQSTLARSLGVLLDDGGTRDGVGPASATALTLVA